MTQLLIFAIISWGNGWVGWWRKVELTFALFYGAWEVVGIISRDYGGQFDYLAH